MPVQQTMYPVTGWETGGLLCLASTWQGTTTVIGTPLAPTLIEGDFGSEWSAVWNAGDSTIDVTVPGVGTLNLAALTIGYESNETGADNLALQYVETDLPNRLIKIHWFNQGSATSPTDKMKMYLQVWIRNSSAK